MKKIIIVVLCAMSLIACQKKYCWKCTIYELNSEGSFDLTNPHNSTECDMTEAQIKAYEKSNTKSVRVFNGNNYQESPVEITHCMQQ